MTLPHLQDVGRLLLFAYNVTLERRSITKSGMEKFQATVRIRIAL